MTNACFFSEWWYAGWLTSNWVYGPRYFHNRTAFKDQCTSRENLKLFFTLAYRYAQCLAWTLQILEHPVLQSKWKRLNVTIQRENMNSYILCVFVLLSWVMIFFGVCGVINIEALKHQELIFHWCHQPRRRNGWHETQRRGALCGS